MDQKARPTRFTLYQENPADEVSLENPISVVPYKGQQFYRSHVGGLAAGTHIFVVRASSTDGIEGLHSGGLVHRISASLPEPAVIVVAESV
jgi:hypothetical protein